MQGPTSSELDAALLRHLGATVLVTKDSGDAGGLREKLRAAELAGATAVVVERPAEPDAVHTTAEVLEWLARLPKSRDAGTAAADVTAVGERARPDEATFARLSRGLLQV